VHKGEDRRLKGKRQRAKGKGQRSKVYLPGAGVGKMAGQGAWSGERGERSKEHGEWRREWGANG